MGAPRSGLDVTRREPGLRLVHRLAPFRRSLVLMSGCLLVQTVYWIATPLLLAHLVDDGLLVGDRAVLTQVIAILVLITVFGELAGVAFDRMSARVLAEVLRQLRQDMFDQLQCVSMGYYANTLGGRHRCPVLVGRRGGRGAVRLLRAMGGDAGARRGRQHGGAVRAWTGVWPCWRCSCGPPA